MLNSKVPTHVRLLVRVSHLSREQPCCWALYQRNLKVPSVRNARCLDAQQLGLNWLSFSAESLTRTKIASTFAFKTLDEAKAARDSVAKEAYSRVFDWLVSLINAKLGANIEDADTFIGILDIFGFEYFEVNSFEQLCINYCNEKLQQVYIQFMFKKEAELYQKEGIDFATGDFTDNSKVQTQ